jgi:hypothetical protein
VTPEAREAFAVALKDPQSAPRSRYYLALAQMQQGDVAGALQAWRSLEVDSPAGAEWLLLLRQRIAAAAGMLGLDPTVEKPAANTPGSPSPSAVAAAAEATAGATAAEREAMIEAMVERLAARLEQQPEDIEGWSARALIHGAAPARQGARGLCPRVEVRPNDPLLQQALAGATAAAAQSALEPLTGAGGSDVTAQQCGNWRSRAAGRDIVVEDRGMPRIKGDHCLFRNSPSCLDVAKSGATELSNWIVSRVGSKPVMVSAASVMSVNTNRSGHSVARPATIR